MFHLQKWHQLLNSRQQRTFPVINMFVVIRSSLPFFFFFCYIYSTSINLLFSFCHLDSIAYPFITSVLTEPCTIDIALYSKATSFNGLHSNTKIPSLERINSNSALFIPKQHQHITLCPKGKTLESAYLRIICHLNCYKILTVVWSVWNRFGTESHHHS